MAIQKKAKSKKCGCGHPASERDNLSLLLAGAGRTLSGLTAQTEADFAYNAELRRVQMDIMKADLRERNAKAQIVEVEAELAKARLKSNLGDRARKSVGK